MYPCMNGWYDESCLSQLGASSELVCDSVTRLPDGGTIIGSAHARTRILKMVHHFLGTGGSGPSKSCVNPLFYTKTHQLFNVETILTKLDINGYIILNTYYSIHNVNKLDCKVIYFSLYKHNSMI